LVLRAENTPAKLSVSSLDAMNTRCVFDGSTATVPSVWLLARWVTLMFGPTCAGVGAAAALTAGMKGKHSVAATIAAARLSCRLMFELLCMTAKAGQ
jgi:hypothetical protein